MTIERSPNYYKYVYILYSWCWFQIYIYIQKRFEPRFVSFIDDYIYGKGKTTTTTVKLLLVQNVKFTLMFSCISTVEAFKLCSKNNKVCSIKKMV